MTINQHLQSGRLMLENISETPYLDAVVLFCHAAEKTKEQLMGALQEQPTPEAAEKYNVMIQQRAEKTPVAYITGIKEFYGRDFHVGSGVLIPRPDTEILIEKTLQIINENNYSTLNILDLCTGTGCIGLTLEKEIKENLQTKTSKIHVTCADISQDAEYYFTKNKQQLEAEADFVQTDIFSNIKNKYDIIATNPPYLTHEECDNKIQEGWKEPDLALRAGDDGLDLIRKIIKESIDYLNNRGYILIESSWWQCRDIEKILEENGFHETEIVKDLAGLDRVTVGRLK